MSGGFYRAFEDKHRGSRELIAERLRVYLPFLQVFLKDSAQAPILDLGCGRGEWLELLTNEGYTAVGVDLDEGMLQACRQLSLPAEHGDALSALRARPDASLSAVTGFHIAEHIPFDDLQTLVDEALRKLRPGGLLILETPNAENISVGTTGFYLDPTHERPIPQLLMSFLVEHSGFHRCKILRLQEPPELHSAERAIDLMSVLGGVSPDFSIVGQKTAAVEVLQQFDQLFDGDYGLSLPELAQRYDSGVDKRIAQSRNEIESNLQHQFETHIQHLLHQFETRLAQTLTHEQLLEALNIQSERQNIDSAQSQADLLDRLKPLYTQNHDLQTHVHGLQSQLATVQRELDQSLANAHSWYLRATAHGAEAEALKNSTSWRATAPLRLVIRIVRWPLTSSRSTMRSQLTRALPHAKLWLARRPSIERRCMALARRSPWLHAKLRSLHQASQQHVATENRHDPLHGVIDRAPLTARGRAIESALRAAITKDQN
ncbi:methyltransferase domain-containing protein [Pseudomonas sp. CFBP 8770]|uniref:class I SAM-dependent methyltransferase n=1 Tax=unclassified Pseudomonas TaxID=196821 RepID=UPI001784F3D0|nr:MULTISPECIES: class I SAM-dependent methyltransferase [unclassified Pseudomonas]MBD8472770.1 methyltransferase domain-containing protein [Pseudomonas sp. CFBP 8773]MBD8646128.1 methyltransferase domain-containing protein [Pseudomonas sp. CFBP 8770]